MSRVDTASMVLPDGDRFAFVSLDEGRTWYEVENLPPATAGGDAAVVAKFGEDEQRAAGTMFLRATRQYLIQSAARWGASLVIADGIEREA